MPYEKIFGMRYRNQRSHRERGKDFLNRKRAR